MNFFNKYSFLVIITLLILGCDGTNDFPTENYLRVRINGEVWEAFQINVQRQQLASGELRITITANSDLNETIFIIIQEFEDRLNSRTQEITSLANGDAIGYRLPGTGTGTETHSSFNCGTTNGSIFVQEYNPTEGYLTGNFIGTVCQQGGQNPITFTEGEFLRLDLD